MPPDPVVASFVLKKFNYQSLSKQQMFLNLLSEPLSSINEFISRLRPSRHDNKVTVSPPQRSLEIPGA